MLFYCGKPKPTRLERKLAKLNRLKIWHKRFAWLPVPISHVECVWLETVLARVVDAEIVSEWDFGDHYFEVKKLKVEWEYERLDRVDSEY